MWLDRVFQLQYLPGKSINYVAINKDLENYHNSCFIAYHVKLKNYYDQVYNDIRAVIATK